MKHDTQESGTTPESGRTPTPIRSRIPRPAAQVVVLSAALLALAGALVWATPDLDQSILPSRPWTFWALALAFGTSLLTVFRIEFRQNAVLFSLSEIPLAFALVYLSPVEGIAARVVASAFVYTVVRRPPLQKLFFNLAMFTFEAAAAYFILRMLVGVDAEVDFRAILSVTVAVALAGIFGSIAVALAVSRFIGETRRHVVDELKEAWVLVVNGAMGGALLSIYLISTTLALLMIIPVAAMWYMMHRYGRLEQRLRDLNAVYGFAGRVGRSLDLEEIGRSAVSETATLLRSDLTVLALVGSDDPDQVFADGLVPASGDDSPDIEWTRLMNFETAELTTGPALAQSRFGGLENFGDVIVSPVDDETGPIGVLVAARRPNRDHDFTNDDVGRMVNLADQLASSLRKGMLHRRMQHEARHDTLTGLPNRLALQLHLADVSAASVQDRTGYVMMIDLDRFKEVNDTLGHHAGDDLLIEFSQRLVSELGPGDFLARLAGDEFAVVTPASDDDEVLAFAQRCVAAASRPMTLNGLSLVVTASVGIARITDDGGATDRPLRQADIAMYDAKARRIGADFYRPDADRRTPARLSMLGDLREAVENGELTVELQPKLDLASTTITGVEALARWTHPVRGVVSPADFVRVAEETGIIRPLTDLMLRQSISTLRHLHDRGHHISMSVNLSTHDLLDANLATRVADDLRRNNVDAAYLTLEITESSLLVDAPRTRATIHELHELGVRMSIDDFGTGYSSLSYLRKLPVSELKVDQSFIATMIVDQQDAVIVRSTIELGHNLGLEVVAEGVETEQILQRLCDLGCDVAQGYAISRPLDTDRFLAWLHTSDFHTRHVDPMRPAAWGDAGGEFDDVASDPFSV